MVIQVSLDIHQFAKASKSQLGQYKYKLSNEMHFMINRIIQYIRYKLLML